MYGIHCEIIHNIKYMFSQTPYEMKEIRKLDLSRNYNIKASWTKHLFHSFTYEFITDSTS
jgi:hypothetical protein